MKRAYWSRLHWLLAAFALVAVVAAACGGDDDDDDTGGDGGDVTYGSAGFKVVEIDAGAPVKIGISSVTSGDLKGLGQPIVDAAKLAGEGKTIQGHPIEWVVKDDQCSADGGAAAANQILQEGVVAAVGPICSGAVVAAQPQYEQAGVTHVSPSSTAHKPTFPDRNDVFQTFLRTTYSDDIQGPAQAKFAYGTLQAKTAYIVYDTDAYGSGLRDAFRKAFEAEGGKIVGTPEGFEKKTTDFKSIVTNIQNAKPDLVYFSGFYAEATPFIKQLRAENKDVKFLSGDGVKNDEFTKGAGADAEGAYLSLPSPVYSGAGYQSFTELFEKATGLKVDSSPFVAESYDAATVIITALEKVAEKDGDKLKIDLKKLNEEIRKVELDGAAGKIKFDARGDNVGGETPVSLFVVKNGAYEEVKN
ncbi:MAG: branched-chain amino acid ABC transporter substrate-binding protein [Chloroflexi bacterium]|nr:branched-chain amino acid ABC transporter substrate-binding protein [Dehalococcoidia bacterium]MCO5202798.1 branched-chain amino acid ABC transporter substrate-binding protein [Chloroflexota bacterium]MCZ7576192.1 branched-chain amino acid ABC transporter substrate-binding protein [Dehalococcoidia bacterium]